MDPSTPMQEEVWSEKLAEAVAAGAAANVDSLLKVRRDVIRGLKTIDFEKIYGDRGLLEALFEAIKQNRSHIAKQLIKVKGFKLSQQNERKRTVLHEAVAMGRIEITRLLLSQAEVVRYVDIGDDIGRSALHEAAGRANDELVQMLLASGADVDVADDRDMTPLHLVIWLRKYETDRNADGHLPENTRLFRMAKRLLSRYGARVNTKDRFGDTPLHDACRNRDLVSARLLLEFGADPFMKNADGHKAQEEISGATNLDISALFTEPRPIQNIKAVPRVPRTAPALPKDELKVCKEFQAYVRYYWRDRGISWATSASVDQIVYKERGRLVEIERGFKEFVARLSPSTKLDKRPDDDQLWRWIHFPANNMTWIKDLMWHITHSKRYDHDPEKKNKIWSFVERTTKDRQGMINWTRLPHVEDSWKEEVLEQSDGRSYNRTKSSSSDATILMGVETSDDTKIMSDIKEQGIAPAKDPTVQSEDEIEASLGVGSSSKRKEQESKASARQPDAEVRAIPSGQTKFEKLPEKRMSKPESLRQTAERDAWKETRSFPSNRMLSFVIPYIDFETDQYLHRDEIDEKDLTLHIKNMTMLRALYPKYSGRAGLQYPMTLDESYYDMLGTDRMQARDDDQVVLKWFRRHAKTRKQAEEANAYSQLAKLHRFKKSLDDEETIAATEDDDDLGFRQPRKVPRRDGDAQSEVVQIFRRRSVESFVSLRYRPGIGTPSPDSGAASSAASIESPPFPALYRHRAPSEPYFHGGLRAVDDSYGRDNDDDDLLTEKKTKTVNELKSFGSQLKSKFDAGEPRGGISRNADTINEGIMRTGAAHMIQNAEENIEMTNPGGDRRMEIEEMLHFSRNLDVISVASESRGYLTDDLSSFGDADDMEDGIGMENLELFKKEGDDRQTIDSEKVEKLLMIHQFWLWKLDENTIITACPDRWHAGAEDTLIDTIRQSGIEQLNRPEDLIEHILFKCATFLDEYRDAGIGDHILDIFESMIAQRSDEEVECFKHFSDEVERREKGQSTDLDAFRSIQTEINLIYEVKDIRDELHLIRRIFETQAEVIEKFTRLFWPGIDDSAKQSREGYIEVCGVKPLIERTIRLNENAGRTLEGLDYLVQVKQAQSSLDEAEAARNLNNVIMLFTVVTIVFTPLSFMTSLFAMPVNDFPHDPKSGNLAYESKWLTGRMFAGELATLGFIFLLMLYMWGPNALRRYRLRRKKPPPPPRGVIWASKTDKSGSGRRFIVPPPPPPDKLGIGGRLRKPFADVEAAL